VEACGALLGTLAKSSFNPVTGAPAWPLFHARCDLQVRAIMRRYKRGEYVPEDELEYAFRALEQRFTW